MKIERLLALVVLLLSRTQVTASQMAQHFGVSKRTIYRDMSVLEAAGFPIVAVYGNEGGYQLMDGFKLHAYTFSEEEKAWLIRAIEMQHGLLDSTGLGREIIAKIELLLREELAPFQVSIEEGTLHRLAIEVETKMKVSCLQIAMSQREKLLISYVAANGQLTNRKISPWQLQLKNGSWYLRAFCDLRQDERYFKLTRMRQIEATTEKADPIQDPKATVEGTKQRVVCLFSANQLGKLYDFFTDQEITPLPNGQISVSFQEEPSKNLLPFLLMFGATVKVIEPESLRKAHLAIITQMKSIY